MYKLSESNLDLLMNDVFKDLDVPLDLRNEAERKYLRLGNWLNTDSQEHFKSDASLYIQGSTLLGTSVRPIKRGDEYDFDLVYRRNIKKEGVSQKDLKSQVGEQLARYIKYLANEGEADIPKLIDGKRCWTLQYQGRFHIDILPALPDPDPDYLMNPEDGIIITDKELVHWQFSNPKGYHSWFKSVMRDALYEVRNSLAKSDGVSIEAIPEEGVKTTLQKTIQILKRHRDSTFKGEKTDRPISIIISTLAGHAYNSSGNLYIALSGIVENMEKFIEKRNGIYWVENPINKKENFADRWRNHPVRMEAFYQWLNLAKKEFSSYKIENDMNSLSEKLAKSLSIDNAQVIVSNAKKRAGLSAAANSVSVKTDPWSC